MPLLTPGTVANVRKQRALTFTHSYTWTKRLGDQTDTEGGAVVTWAPDVLSKPCHLLPQETMRVDASGAPIEVQAPRLVVPWDDLLADGDLVKEVADASGAVVLAGPAEVQEVEPQLAADVPTHRIAVLSFERAQR